MAQTGNIVYASAVRPGSNQPLPLATRVHDCESATPYWRLPPPPPPKPRGRAAQRSPVGRRPPAARPLPTSPCGSPTQRRPAAQRGRAPPVRRRRARQGAGRDSRQPPSAAVRQCPSPPCALAPHWPTPVPGELSGEFLTKLKICIVHGLVRVSTWSLSVSRSGAPVEKN